MKYLIKEIWKEHESGLMVSSWGRVFVPKSGKHLEHITYGTLCKDGYLQVGYKRKIYKVHRLVAECFIPNPNDYTEVNHKDENKQNNHVDNLEWCSASYNCNYGTRIERIVEKLSKAVLQYDLGMNLIKEWSSANECGRNGFNCGGISQCCNGNKPQYKGFIWKYKE